MKKNKIIYIIVLGMLTACGGEEVTSKNQEEQIGRAHV